MIGRARSEREVPDHIWRITMHYHDLVHIKEYWERTGIKAPQPFIDELQRSHDRLMAVLEEENTQGGAFHNPTKGLKE